MSLYNGQILYSSQFVRNMSSQDVYTLHFLVKKYCFCNSAVLSNNLKCTYLLFSIYLHTEIASFESTVC